MNDKRLRAKEQSRVHANNESANYKLEKINHQMQGHAGTNFKILYIIFRVARVSKVGPFRGLFGTTTMTRSLKMQLPLRREHH